ncbi:hypothetical protein F4778DRAFT_167847 [Xylariomycetidae sp. FL2044]|nr:hypothetical protein F4778DRAFT_167847 [Xylariomycetidae sp. FL2044]
MWESPLHITKYRLNNIFSSTLALPLRIVTMKFSASIPTVVAAAATAQSFGTFSGSAFSGSAFTGTFTGTTTITANGATYTIDASSIGNSAGTVTVGGTTYTYGPSSSAGSDTTATAVEAEETPASAVTSATEVEAEETPASSVISTTEVEAEETPASSVASVAPSSGTPVNSAHSGFASGTGSYTGTPITFTIPGSSTIVIGGNSTSASVSVADAAEAVATAEVINSANGTFTTSTFGGGSATATPSGPTSAFTDSPGTGAGAHVKAATGLLALVGATAVFLL